MKMKTFGLNALLVCMLLSTAFAGCLDRGAQLEDTVTIRIAYTVQDDYDNPDADPNTLVDFIAEQTGAVVELYPITSDGAAIEAVRFGHADIAFLDGGSAYLAWKMHGMEAIVADENSDGSTSYTAAAWVLNSSNITSLEQLEGNASCHTGWLKSAGMLMPMGYMIGAGMVDVEGDTEDIESLRTTIESHFSTATIPAKGELYYGYDGAFQCMTEGEGDVAFAKTSSYEDHCEGNDWCLDRDEYRILEPHFGQVPSHPVMVGADVDETKVELIRAALLALNTVEGGDAILENVLNTAGYASVDSESHLGDYSENLDSIPGIEAYLSSKYA